MNSFYNGIQLTVYLCVEKISLKFISKIHVSWIQNPLGIFFKVINEKYLHHTMKIISIISYLKYHNL